MQVFLPHLSISDSVRCLDKSRLGNQVWREAKTLINGGWPHHPVAKLWANYKPYLSLYCLHGLDELNRKGWIDPMKSINLAKYFLDVINQHDNIIHVPWWILDNSIYFKVVESHRRNLLFKDPVYYSQFNWGPVPTTKPDYFWPSLT